MGKLEKIAVSVLALGAVFAAGVPIYNMVRDNYRMKDEISSLKRDIEGKDGFIREMVPNYINNTQQKTVEFDGRKWLAGKLQHPCENGGYIEALNVLRDAGSDADLSCDGDITIRVPAGVYKVPAGGLVLPPVSGIALIGEGSTRTSFKFSDPSIIIEDNIYDGTSFEPSTYTINQNDVALPLENLGGLFYQPYAYPPSKQATSTTIFR